MASNEYISQKASILNSQVLESSVETMLNILEMQTTKALNELTCIEINRVFLLKTKIIYLIAEFLSFGS